MIVVCRGSDSHSASSCVKPGHLGIKQAVLKDADCSSELHYIFRTVLNSQKASKSNGDDHIFIFQKKVTVHGQHQIFIRETNGLPP